MSNPKLCSIDGCGKPVIARGWCNAHYCRWSRHGDPLKGRTGVGEPEKFVAEVVLPYAGTECLIWPFARSGKNKAQPYVFDGSHMVLASREVCRRAHGQPPSPLHHAAHSCGNGDLGCVTPGHLSWKTPVENEADKIGHGTKLVGSRVGNSRLKEHQVIYIMSLKGQASSYQVAKQFDVHYNTILAIWRGRAWGWLTGQALETAPVCP